jgi:hypothetical protein
MEIAEQCVVIQKVLQIMEAKVTGCVVRAVFAIINKIA